MEMIGAVSIAYPCWNGDASYPKHHEGTVPAARRGLELPALYPGDRMSKNSKAKRDKKRKQQGKRPFQRLNRDVPVENHAVMQDEEGRVVAAIGLQGTEWLLSVGGQTMGGGDNPVPMLAMLMHLQKMQQQEGNTVTLEYSTQLTQFVADLAADEGKTPDEYLAQLATEFENSGDGEEEETSPEAEASEGGDSEPAKPAE